MNIRTVIVDMERKDKLKKYLDGVTDGNLIKLEKEAW